MSVNKEVEGNDGNEGNSILQVAIMNEHQQNQLENSMKDLLEKILTYMEKFIKTKEDLQSIEGKLSDYDNLHSLLDIIKSIFSHLTIKIDEQLEKVTKQLKQSQPSNQEGNADYDQLEKILQKHEADIRFHIRSNQTMKLYQENLQQKLDESEQSRTELLESTKLMISDIKRQNNQLGEQISKLEAENKLLQERIIISSENERNYEEKMQTLPFLHEKIQTLERIIKEKNYDKNSSGGAGSQQQQQTQHAHQQLQQLQYPQLQQLSQNSQLTSSNFSGIGGLQKENSLKKMSSGMSNSGGSSINGEYELKKPIRKQILQYPQPSDSNNPQVISSLQSTQSTSSFKAGDRRAPTPTLTTQQNKQNTLKSSYQRFYNNVKGTNREESGSAESVMTATALLPRKSLPNGVIANGTNNSHGGVILDGKGDGGVNGSLSSSQGQLIQHNGQSLHVNGSQMFPNHSNVVTGNNNNNISNHLSNSHTNNYAFHTGNIQVHHLHTNSSSSSNNNYTNTKLNKELKTAPSLPTNQHQFNSSSKNGYALLQIQARAGAIQLPQPHLDC